MKETEQEEKKMIFEPKEKRDIRSISPSKLFVGELNERMEIGDINGLATSIKEVGILEPLLVRPVGDKFEIIAGRRRFEAGKLVRLTHYPCQIKEMNDVEALKASLDENEQRKSANPVEQGLQCYRMRRRLGSEREVAAYLGKSTQWVKSRIQAYELYQDTSVPIAAKGPAGLMEGETSPRVGIADTMLIQSALKSRPVERYIIKQKPEKWREERQRMAKELAEVVKVMEPSKKRKFITEFKKNPAYQIHELAHSIANEPSELKLSVYFPPKLGKAVVKAAEKNYLSPSKWLQNIAAKELISLGLFNPNE